MYKAEKRKDMIRWFGKEKVMSHGEYDYPAFWNFDDKVMPLNTLIGLGIKAKGWAKCSNGVKCRKL